jgi:predicted HTH transcriptional regulator
MRILLNQAVATPSLQKKVHKPNLLVARKFLKLRKTRNGMRNLQMMSSLSMNGSNAFETSKRNMGMLMFQKIVENCLVMKDLEDGVPL